MTCNQESIYGAIFGWCNYVLKKIWNNLKPLTPYFKMFQILFFGDLMSLTTGNLLGTPFFAVELAGMTRCRLY